MKKKQCSDTELIRLINKHPNIKMRIETILKVAEAAVDGLIKADDVEMQVQESVRALGQNTIESWAKSQERGLATQEIKKQNTKKHTKKNSTGTRPLV